MIDQLKLTVAFPPRHVTAVALVLLAAVGGTAAQSNRPLVPQLVGLHPSAQAAIDAAWLTDAERRALRVFHGVWDERDLDTPQARAVIALNAWNFDDDALSDPAVPAEIRAEALARRGELREAIDILSGADTNRAARIRAEALEDLGDHDAADRATAAPIRRLTQTRTEDPEELTEGVRALMVRARIQGQPARDYETMLMLLTRAHQELDRLYWPARLAEAQLLIDKDNEKQAVDALHETLALNPRSGGAWYTLGRVALRRFDFDSVALAARHLQTLNPQHPLADLLRAESRLYRDDPDGAMELLEPLLERLPKLREALALVCAAEAMRYDEAAMRRALDRYEQISPGSAQTYYVVGRHLSLNRQYEAAARMLNEAIRRQPAWPAPQIELGLMELQSGRDAKALAALEDVARLDEYNNRAANSLHLLRQLAEYDRIETEHFVIRYHPGIDQVMVDMMAEPLERIHETVSTRFNHEPDRKTVIEVLPDHESFAVRITGMPGIHTIAASTGPVIAFEVPREGPPSKHKGPYDWVRVVQHEYTHTITLSQTRNRIPHWLTEGAAVSMERAPRDYDTCQLLAEAWTAGTLFDLDEIKWAFVRPRRPGDRALAYAQAHWMVEYMDERFGESALVRLLELYFEGVREQEAVPRALGISRQQFCNDFVARAGDELRAWGLLPDPLTPTLEDLEDELRWADPQLAEVMVASQQARLDAIARTLADRIGRAAGPRMDEQERRFAAERWPKLIRPAVQIDNGQLEEWLELYPQHPDLLELRLRREIRESGAPDASLIEMLQRYAEARPVDPFPHKKLAQIWLDSDTPARAIPHLEHLDRHEQKSPVFALELAKLLRRDGQKAQALAMATRAAEINPYEPSIRVPAAEIAIEAGRLDLARNHIVALTMLEPDHLRHHRRLEAIDRMIARGD
ncbi:MAG: peptidase MA family metallohydrolase [Planctomycetota bacterium]|jgi:predicted Zn-dependent protease